MEHRGTVTIATHRLLLRPFVTDDAEAAFTNWESDELVTRFLTWPPYSRLREAEKIMREWVESYSDPSFYHWAIELTSYREPIGTISVVECDEKAQSVQIGYCIGRKWWHQGITTEAVRALIPFFFTQVRVNRIEARHDPKNPHSGHVMEKCGLLHEGTLRQASWNNTGIADSCIHALLRDEWLHNHLSL